MKAALFALAAALVAVPALAKCPNNCNAHGRCTVDDLCLCFPGFTGFDCSERACPAAEAWAVNDEVNPHVYAECANRGICDRSSGECRCFDGFTGAACERHACPNDCSGHGRCRMIQDFPNFVQDSTLEWYERSIQACLCDGGWTGPDCSMRQCPRGDDPVTQCDRDGRVEQVQQVRVYVPKKLDAATGDATPGISDVVGIIGDEVYLSFKDVLGNNYTTQRVVALWGDSDITSDGPIAISSVATYAQDTSAESVFEAALESLPNFAIRDVTVSHTDSGVSDDYVENKFKVTFHHLNAFQNNYGAQNLLTCHTGRPCPGAGCQPRVRQSYLAAQYVSDFGTNGDWDYSLVAPANLLSTPWVTIHRDSVLSCPYTDGVQESCSTVNRNRLMAALVVVYRAGSGAGTDGEIWVRGVGANDADMVDLTDQTTILGSSWAWRTDLTVATYLTDNDFTYAGTVDSSSAAKVDISKVIPNTWITLDTAQTDAATELGSIIFFEPARCEVLDVTEDDTAGSEEGLTNPDVENIECSGRGECNRDAGNCECFEGYSGLACEMQNTIV